VNLYLCEKSQSNRFVTLFLFAFDEDGVGEYLSAGHNPAYLFRGATGEIEELVARDLVLGAFSFAKYQSVPIRLNSGDLLFIYTDGITEAMNPHDEMFGEERLIELIRRNAVSGCEVVEREVLASLEDFTEGMSQTDDMTYMVVQKV
jgi:sigma-B regulation protein RsbU (phosphoserine phosphatase)